MDEEIKALRSELALLKLQFSQRVDEVESRLESLLSSQIEREEEAHSAKELTQANPSNVNQTTQMNTELDEFNTSPAKDSTPMSSAVSLGEPAKPSFVTMFLMSLMSYLFDWFSPVEKIYQSYKERGMLGTFVLTIAGIGLTLAGFGYLMQLLIDQLGTGAKSMLMCFAALFVIALGVTLKFKTRFREFAAAIVSLGLLLSYNTVYYSGSVYDILPMPVVLVAYLAIALSCHLIALWLDTKVIAVLGIVGISTMPILSNTVQMEPIYYLLSLILVTASSLVLAHKRVGTWLANITLVFSYLSIEWVLSFEGLVVPPWVVEAFFVMFFSFVVANLYQQNKATKQLLVFLAATIGATVLLIYQVNGVGNLQTSISFGINTLLAAVVAFAFHRFNREITSFLVLVSAVWAVLSVVNLFSNSYWGMAWAAEGVLLLLLGRRYDSSFIVNQGQVLTGSAIVYSLVGLSVYFPLPALKTFDGWMLSLFIVASLAIWLRFINEARAFNAFTKTKVRPLLELAEVVWISTLTIASLDIILGNWTGAVVILAQLAILFRARQCRHTIMEVFVALLILVPLFYVFQGAELVGSYRFTTLPLFAKLALVSAFVQLWLWSEFYRRFYRGSKLDKAAEWARIVFYVLIPICWINSAARHLDRDILLVLWLSPLLALFLFRKVQHKALEIETKILTVLTSVTFVLLVGQLSDVFSIIAMSIGLAYFGLTYWLNSRNEQAIYQYICSCALITLGFAIPHFVGSLTGEFFYGLLAASIYWSAAMNLQELSDHLKRNKKLISIVSLSLVFISWGLLGFGIEYLCPSLIYIAAALYQKDKRFMQTPLGQLFKANTDLMLHAMFAISYVLGLLNLADMRLDLLVAPALAVQGAVILFLKDKRPTTVKFSFMLIGLGVLKLAFIDAASALLWQKVILFMGIGVFILFASFWYQKLVKSPLTDNFNENVDA